MSLLEFLSHLEERQVRLWAEGDRLRFRAPDGALTPELRQQLAARKAEVLDFLRQPEPSSGPPPVTPRLPGEAQTLPLSFSQQRLWFLDQLEGGRGTAYNERAAVELRGELRVAALASAIQRVVERHEALRTRFPAQDPAAGGDGQPVQVVDPPSRADLPLLDLRALPPAARSAQVAAQAQAESERAFDLARGPLVRARLLRLETAPGSTRHVLLLTLHHIVSDGWSTAIFLGELSAFYEERLTGRPAALPPLPVQYADYALWQRRWLSGEVLEGQLAWWRRQLAAAPERLELPWDRPRPRRRSSRGGLVRLRLPAATAQALRALARPRGATLFMTLLAGFGALLARHGRLQDLVIGSPVAGRERPELEGLIGFFVNTLAFRLDLRPPEAGPDRLPSLGQLLARVREFAVGAFAHADVPFEQVVEALGIPRSLSHPPLCQVMFALENAPRRAPHLPGLELAVLPLAGTVAKFDLTLILEEAESQRIHPENGHGGNGHGGNGSSPGDGDLVGFLEYSADLLDATTVARWADHLARLLAEAAAAPDLPLDEVPLLSAPERHQLRVEWPAPALASEAPDSTATTLVSLFVEHAERTPEAVAVIALRGEEVLLQTYGELDTSSRRLAGHLRGQGVRPGVAVGICLERGPHLLPALLGVLRAGGFYVPLDPAYPLQRLRFLVEDSGVALVVTEGRLAERLPQGVARLLVDEVPDDPRTFPDATLHSSTPAYLTYTSGSTGRPKGVVISHDAVLSRVWRADYFRATPRDVFLQYGPLAFDASTFELWAPLVHGARVVLMPAGQATAGELVAAIRRHGVTTSFLTTGLFNLLIDELVERGEEESLASLRLLLTGGESMSIPHARTAVAILDHLGHGARLLNVYGPTENTTFSTGCPLRNGASYPSGVPIGRSIRGSRAVVLDGAGRLSPMAVPGELLLGGRGLAQAYHRRPALTAERFVPDPLADGSPERPAGGRLYRSGDLARCLAGGAVEYLGRLDQQVKLRGFRIEPGEVEAHLLEHPAVSQALVMVREDRAGQRRLVAYAVGDRQNEDTERIEPESLRHFLAGRLPEPLVPAVVVWIDALPLTPNGKVDRRALPPPEELAAIPAAAFAAPRTPLEQRLALLWAEVLGIEAVGRDEDFFALGGHSLLATRLVSRLRQRLRRELPLAAIFEAPTVAALAARLEAEAASEAAAPPLALEPSGRRAGPAPLSFAQQRLWFLHRLEPASPAYHVPAALSLQGWLDAAALAGSLRLLVERHEVLRTVFEERQGRPFQAVRPAPRQPLPAVDLTALAPARRQAEARRLLGRGARLPFDLGRDFPFRAALLRLKAEEHVLLLMLHHVAADGWSLGVIVRELAAAYPALSQNQSPRLPPLPLQYGDFARWQRRWLRGEALAAPLRYWTERLQGAPPLELATDRPRTTAPGQARRRRGGLLRFSLAPDKLAALEGVATAGGATLFMVLMAAFQTLLGRLAGQRDLCVGTPIAGRTRAELEGLVGFFVNTLALRADLGGDPSFAELLGRTRRVALEAFEHQELPFERLVEALETERDLDRTPLFQTVCALQNAPLEELRLPGLKLQPLDLEPGAAKFDLSLSLTVEGVPARLGGILEYDADLFDATTARRLAGQFQGLLEAIGQDPGRRLSTLPWYTPAQRHQLLWEWGPGSPAGEDALPPLDPGDSLARRFRQQALRFAARTAVTLEGPDGETNLTYKELAREVSRLAAWLRGRGVGPEVRVGICLERSPRLLVALLAVLEAGGAYVPLDPVNPPERLAFLVEDSGAVLLLTEGACRDRLPLGTEVVDLDAVILEAAEQAAAPRLEGPAAADHLAYVIYTSGSTGRPKGVGVTHGNVLRLFDGAASWGRFSETDVWTLFHSYAFDFSVWEIWGALLYGGRLVVVPSRTARSPRDFAGLLQRQAVTVLNQTPSAFRALAAETLPGATPLRLVVFGGEALDPTSLEPWFEVHGDRQPRLLNLYGITETTVHATLQPLSAQDLDPGIGRPLTDLTAFVLDDYLRPQPVGVPGELCIGGPGLARGYLGRPALTASRFVPDPCSHQPGRRLYRSGDRARWQTTGALDYLGRIDHQVKVRGFRIEPGEIETALGACAGVREAKVLPFPSQGETALAAFLTGENAPGAEAELRRQLRERLPEYMVPGRFVFVEALPLTANGKVDRAALLGRLQDGGAEAATARRARPRGALESALLDLWQEVLERSDFGIQDSFFDLGGHSLLATRLASRVRQRFGVELPVRDVFDSPTVAALARAIEGLQALDGAASGENDLVPLPVAAGTPRPLSFAQERLWFLHRMDPESASYHLPAVLELRGDLDPAALARAFAALERRHEVLRTTFEEREGSTWQVVQPPRAAGEILPWVDFTGLADDACRQGALEAVEHRLATAPFDLRRGPMLRPGLLRLGRRHHRLALTLHHVAADGWSLGVLGRELSALYAAELGAGTPLPPLPVQYADFAAWQRRWLEGAEIERQLAYWRETLLGARPLELPADRPRPPVQSLRGALLPLSLPANLARAARDLARRQGVTLFMTLTAAFLAVLRRHAGHDDLCLGTPIANRGRAQLEGLVGFFANMLVLRCDLGDDPAFEQLLAGVEEAALGAYAHQDLPFERLVEALGLPRDLSRSPLFQVVFSLQNAPAAELELPGITARSVAVDVEATKFDLNLLVQEAGPRDGPEPGALAAVVEYSTDLFDRTTVRRLAGHWQTLLAAAVADPRRRLSQLPLLSTAERHQLEVESLSPAAQPFARPGAQETLHSRFLQTARRFAERVAVTGPGGEKRTYAELDADSARLAVWLRRQGVGPEVQVGVCLERSPRLVTALLAVLRAGGAYVPLDPINPAERLAFLLEDSGALLVLTEGACRECLPESAAEVVDLDELDLPKHADEVRAPGRHHAGQLAYVIYTSGSTGRPKGVGVRHGNVLRLFDATAGWMPFGADDVWTLFHSYAFDFSVWEIWGALLHGGRLVVVPGEVARSPADFAELLHREGVTVLNQTPSAFGALIPERLARNSDSPDALRLVVFGGEALDFEALAPWFARYGDRQPRLVNMYGITETTVHVTYRPVAVRDLAGSRVGGPIPDLALRVLSPDLRQLPLGVPGELFVGEADGPPREVPGEFHGAGLSRGYLGRPGLTAARFLPDPFAAHPGARLYRTGDLGRWRMGAGGADLDYLGRLDRQVQVRGFRVELGEIESALSSCPGVRQAVVLAVADGPAAEVDLAAFVVGDASEEVLRAHLRRRLPEYMVPGRLVGLTALPVTANDKVDRGALRALLDRVDEEDVESLAAPLSELERRLAAVWAAVLERPELASGSGLLPIANFFDLGGHSLRATRLAGRIQGEFRVDFSLREVFLSPTLGEQAALLEDRLGGGGARIPALAPAASYAVSHAQRRLWVLWQMDREGSVYNVPAALLLQGNLEVGALERALGRLVARHESLRTVFRLEGGEPRQVVLPVERSVPLPRVDLQGLADPLASVRALVAAEARAPFDLEAGPLWRARLLVLQASRGSARLGQAVLCLNLHHVVGDAWSLGVLARELSAVYAAEASGGDGDPLLPLRVQSKDFAVWQNEWLRGQAAAASRAFWHGRLVAPLPVLDLPADRPRPAVRSQRGAVVAAPLERELVAGLRSFCRESGASFFMGLLAAVYGLLLRLSGQRDLVVGSPMAGRAHPDLEGQIGFFVNTLPLRLRLRRGMSFAALVAAVREEVTAAFAHQDYPFDRLVDELRVARETSRSPVFGVMVALQGQEAVELALPGVEATPLEIPVETAKVDLAFHFAEQGAGDGGASLVLEYSSDLFDATRVHRTAGQLRRLLAAALVEPKQALENLDLLTAAQRQQLILEWNDTAGPYDRDCCLHELFAAQARRRPDAWALYLPGPGGERLTYGELARRASELSGTLRRLGVGREVPVGLFLQRSVELVVGVLAILEAGGTYLPLDPDYPPARLAFMLADTGAPLVLTTEALRDQLPESDSRVLCLGASEPDSPHLPPLAPVAVDALDVAYVMYTSGSTGRPRGVRVHHRGVVRLVQQGVLAEFGEDERVLQLSTICFDASTIEIWGALVHGAELVLYPPRLPSLEELGTFLRREAITTLFLTPGLYQRLIDERPDDLAGVRHLLTGGDVMQPAKARALFERLPGCRQVNCYGPTEGSSIATVFPVTGPVAATVPIGRPMRNTRVYVLDASLQPVPAGVPGELYLGEDCLARDYFGRPATTAERFVPDPFGRETGLRLYRTGDLVRAQVDGNLEFLGRLDHQVKIRGFRVEPGEVEAVLGGHPAVGDVLVAARPDPAGGKRLVAWVTPDGQENGNGNGNGGNGHPEGGALDRVLRRYLEERLPRYLVPSAVLVLDRLPLMPSGKIDRGALPDPDTVARPARSAVQATSSLERALAEIWRRILGVAEPGVDESFFDLGGHSVAMIEAHREISRWLAEHRPGRLPAGLPVVKLFEHPTIAALARYLEAATGDPAAPRPGASPAAPDTDQQDRAAARRQALLRSRRDRRPRG